MDDVVAYAKKYTEDILAFFEINPEVAVQIKDDIVMIEIADSDSNRLLIGRNGETLRSIQQLISSTLRNRDLGYSRVTVDIAGYRKQREEKVARDAREWIEQVRRTGDSYVANLNAADRRIVHQVSTEFSDISTFSEGEGRDRKIIIAQKSS